ncbi:unnamed protein product [Parnassius apollo]|uniref:(apollo) hypothetical protein n=1 Tax=Parnassius apollo TaxID=110799 RepID=A0A8S3Y1H8_PARAO|nr:unnamed protein product [Parnassius apollo]
MSSHEDEVKDLIRKNSELVQKVQYWKVTAAQREKEKLELTKEINELRLKLSRIRNGGAAQACQLDAALQAASQEALTHLVQASSAVARTMDLVKTFTRERQELDASSPRWSAISGTPTTDRVNRVPPLLIGGQSIQPVVSLSRTLLNTSGSRSINRSPNQNHNVTERAVPMHMLQDVYIPLTRIDAAEVLHNNVEADADSNTFEDSTEDLGLEDSTERVLEDSQNPEIDETETSRRLDVVAEELEPEDDERISPIIPSIRVEDPLEGPSWLLDIQNIQSRRRKSRVNFEPDSTTELDESARVDISAGQSKPNEMERLVVPDARQEFTPTVRRRKRSSSPRAARRTSVNGRVLKVLIAKMSLGESEGISDVSPLKRTMRDRTPPRLSKNKALLRHSSQDSSPSTPPLQEGVLSKRLKDSVSCSPGPTRNDESPSKSRKEDVLAKIVRFDAPSPNGSTDARVIVSESRNDPYGSGEPLDTERVSSRDKKRVTRCETPESRDTQESRRQTENGSQRRDQESLVDSRDSDSCRDARDSDSSSERTEGRARRARKPVTYKEKPLNRKLRR